MRITTIESDNKYSQNQKVVTIELAFNDLCVMDDVIGKYIKYMTEHTLALDDTTTKIVNMIREAVRTTKP